MPVVTKAVRAPRSGPSLSLKLKKPAPIKTACASLRASQEACEPDARKHLCDNCGQHQVYGAEESF